MRVALAGFALLLLCSILWGCSKSGGDTTGYDVTPVAGDPGVPAPAADDGVAGPSDDGTPQPGDVQTPDVPGSDTPDVQQDTSTTGPPCPEEKTACTITNQHGSCAGDLVCPGGRGPALCTAREPAPEVCNATDDDCDGETDEGLALCDCGDGTCAPEGGETAERCPCDCHECGDGICAGCQREDPSSCQEDCCRTPEGPSTCGDGYCLGYGCGEDPRTCPDDCGRDCGNGVCEGGENPYGCPEDCKRGECGNGVCEPTDGGPFACPADCATTCGDCLCEGGESWVRCPIDCGYCGDGVCSTCARVGDSVDDCAQDCCVPVDDFDGTCDGRDDDCDGAVDEDSCDDGDPCTTDQCEGGEACYHEPSQGLCGASGLALPNEEVRIEDPVGGVSVVIPAGAVSDETGIRFEPAPEHEGRQVEGEQPGVLVRSPWRFEPEGQQFALPVTITLPIRGEPMAGGSRVLVVGFEGQSDAWRGERLEDGSALFGLVSQDGRSLSFTIDHFSIHGFARPGEQCGPDCRGRACTGDGCGGACGGEGVDLCDDQNECTADRCDPEDRGSGEQGCVHEALEGIPCDAGEGEGSGMCIAGACAPSLCGDGFCAHDEAPALCPRDCPLEGFALVPPGSFEMGSPPQGDGWDEIGVELPQRTVHITRPLWAKKTEVTQEEWSALMGAESRPSLHAGCGDDCPVEQVTWWEALAWCNARSTHEGLPECYTLNGCNENTPGEGMVCGGVEVNTGDGNPLLCEGYRLPTEAEWEYFARAGTTTYFFTGKLSDRGDYEPKLDPVAWYRGSEKVSYAVKDEEDNPFSWPGPRSLGTHPAGAKQANAWGLHDTAGNVAEWVWNRFYWYWDLPDPDVDPVAGAQAEDSNVVRGGGFADTATGCRASSRSRVLHDARDGGVGFRPVRTVGISLDCGDEGACDDANPCTTDECRDGSCWHVPLVCDDDNPCTEDACLGTADGGCAHDAQAAEYRACVPDGISQDDSGACVSGTCMPEPICLGDDCDDGDPCTIDDCAGDGCFHHYDGSHGLPCNIGGPRGEGVCVESFCDFPQECGDKLCTSRETAGTCAQDCLRNGFALIPRGVMEPIRLHWHRPTVHITRPFWMKTTEVTRGEWKALMGADRDPSRLKACGDDCPVESLNWWEALAWCNARSAAEGYPECFTLEGCNGAAPGEGMECTGVEVNAKGGNPLLCEGYRLPTEAEWEHATRAGTSTDVYQGNFSSGDYLEVLGPIAWFGENSLASYEGGWPCGPDDEHTCGPQPAGTKEPNGWGLHDSTGNVWEWVWDWYADDYSERRPNRDYDPAGPASGHYRIFRGGHWGSSYWNCRAGERFRHAPEGSGPRLGFRPARSVSPCRDHNARGGVGCPATVYEVKRGERPFGERVKIASAVVVAVGRDYFFVSADPSDAAYGGPDYSGLFVFLPDGEIPPLSALVSVEGRVKDHFGQIQLTDTEVEILSIEGTMPAPVLVQPADIVPGGSRTEALESVLVEVRDVEVTESWPEAQEGENVSGEFVVTGGLRVDDALYYMHPKPAVGQKFRELRGVLRYTWNRNKLLPRSYEDVVFGPPSLLAVEPAEAMIYAPQTGSSTPPLFAVLTSPAITDTFVPVQSSAPELLDVGWGGPTVPEGETTAEILLVSKAAGGPVTLTATLEGKSHEAQVTVLAADRVPVPVSLVPEKSEIGLMESVELTLELDVPAPPAGVSAELTVSGMFEVNVPSSVVVVGGERSATFELTASDMQGEAVVRATLGDNFVETSVTVRPRPEVGLLLVEVFPDAVGQDDGKEWVKLYNGTYETVSLSGYSLGYGGVDYAWGSYQLEGTIPAGACFVVGGPTSDDSNFRPALDQAAAFDPNLQNSGDAADGVALFGVRADQITAQTLPLDALVYGPVNSSGLIGSDGEAVATPHAAIPRSGTSLIRTGLATWGFNDTPNDRACVRIP